jgi:hypothetical protein
MSIEFGKDGSVSFTGSWGADEKMVALIESVAVEIAEANNGGMWATHYTDEQKDVWRNRAKKIIAMVRDLEEIVI